jgi:acetolactate synthase-1/2/3 large subunit
LKKLSDFVMEFVAGTGVKHVFLLSGGACMHLVDSAGRTPGLEYVCPLHEQACAFAGEAYAEVTNGLGVVLVTAGPGGTNAITGVAAAWLESASLLVISGQAKRADLIAGSGVRSMGQQEVAIVPVVTPITKYAVTVLDPESIRFHLEKAVYLATHGRRGPVWIDIPLDVQAAIIDETSLSGFEPEPEPAAPGPRVAPAVAAAIDLFNRAERPVLFLGNGARGAHTSGALGKLIELLDIPVLLTWKAADMLPDTDPRYAGRPGAIGQRAANFTQQNADHLIVLGARLDLPSIAFSRENFARAATKVMVDVDAAELGKMRAHLDVEVCDDAAAFVDELLRQSARIARRDRFAWLVRCRQWNAKYPVVLPEYWNEEGAVNPYVLMDVLSDEATGGDLLIPGSSGPCSDIFMQAFRVKPGQRIANAPGLGAMGTGLPGSIGGCLAGGRRRTICVNGDGGFQLNIQELETLRRLHLPIKYFVLCNGGYASIMAMQRNYFEARYVGSAPSSHFTLPDITRVAEAYGIATTRLSSHQGIREKVREVLRHDGPIVCAVDVSPDQPTAPRVTSSVRSDGRMESRPMEDMAPLLPREEFRANMIVEPLEESE